jgi:hypothetical protein
LELGVRLLCTAGERGNQQHAQKHWSGQFRNTPLHSVSSYSRFRAGEHKQFLVWERLFFEAVAAVQHPGFGAAAASVFGLLTRAITDLRSGGPLLPTSTATTICLPAALATWTL